MAEGIHAAIELHQRGRLAEAESVYLELLRRNQNDADALHYLGVLRMSQGRGDEAAKLLKQSLHLAPRNAPAWNSLANVSRATDNPSAAEFAYTMATKLEPDYAEAWYNLANLLRGQQRRDDAVRCYRRVIELNPRFAGAYENVAMLLKRMGREDLAAEAFRKWHAAEPENPIARHMAAAYLQAAAPERAADGFVANLFDRMAPSFDRSLAALDYAAPGLLVAALSEVIPFAERRLAILDAGCGTGLCGPPLRSSARRLVGVDLSAGMLAKARERQVYDELHESELVAFMRAHPAAYDLVISADTLVYFGALEDALAAAALALIPGGVLAFTVEAQPPGSAEKFLLHGHGRYSHGETYLRDCLAAAGFGTLRFEPGVLRKEGGADVRGFVILAQRAAT